ncbi:hypothetical protein QQF64_023765 [Cirrhinus molitorella]|uniref:Fibronectin type-III domain-containing protein n=1 Tax=Cirrhinus molitorella TaxID=172907 RepID=A0ABR3NJY8_9TELE
MAHYDSDIATHVVTALLYGADACFVFDREVSSDEDKMEIDGNVKAVFEKLKCFSDGNIEASMKLNDSQKAAVQKFNCTFYGDFQLPSNPTSFEDAMEVFKDLPKLLGENKDLVVPLRVWLYPLDKLFSRVVKFQHEISIGLCTNIESVIESLSMTEMKCSDLLKDTPALTFTAFHDQINDMKKNCYQCKLILMKELGSLLPKIRGKFIEDAALIDLLRDHEKSPFERSVLEQWLKQKEKESDIIKTLLTQLNESEAKVEINLNKNVMNLEVKHSVSYTFTSLDWPDVLLSKQKAFLSHSTKEEIDWNSSEFEHKTWLSPDIQKTMRNNFKIFKNLIDLNDSKSVKFIVSSKEIENNPGSCILLYEDECNEAICFTPPSKPDCPVIEDVIGTQVVLKVPLYPATEELKLLYKMKEDNDWTSQTLSENQDTVTLNDLRPDTEYSIKCTAVGKLKYTVDSDVTRLTVINQNLIKAKESAIENLSWTENKCSVFLENTKETTFSAIHKKIQDMRRNCQKYRQDFSDRIKSVIKSVKSCEKESCALMDLLQAHNESPFNEKSLKEWITVKEKELNTVNEFLRQLIDFGAEVNGSLDSYLSDIELKNVFCYTFSSLECSDELLNEQENYKIPQKMRNPQKKTDVVSQSWLTGSIREKMREHLKIFKELMTSHSSQNTKFMVSIKDHEEHPGSCILLYENGHNEAVCFISPSKPITVQQVGYRQVVLKVSPPCPATEELKLLYKIKEEKDWISQMVSENQDTVTLTDLRPDTEYNIKCAAVRKLKYAIESDVTTVTTKDKNDLIMKCILIKDGNPARYCVQKKMNNGDQSKPYRKITFGERDRNRTHKVILMLGETGAGKTTLINVMVNYMLGVQREENVWFEITHDQSDRTSVHSQTSIITVYGFYLQESLIDLTIIDTPGYGNTCGLDLDKKIAESLLSLSESAVGIQEIHAVCLVIKATQNRLSDRQTYIFDAVQSLFGRDVAKNIVLLFTHSDGKRPKNAMKAVEEAKIKCAVNDKNQPVFFLFDNCQSEPDDEDEEEYQTLQQQAWNRSYRGMTRFFMFLDNINPKTCQMT